MFNVTTIPMEQFALRWRFTDPKFAELPPEDLLQVQPLSAESARGLWDLTRPLHRDFPFTKDVFPHVDATALTGIEETATRTVTNWLEALGIPSETTVSLSYDRDCALRTPWRLLVRYWDDFWYPGSDDLTVVDETMTWALLFWHEEQAFFGRRGRP